MILQFKVDKHYIFQIQSDIQITISPNNTIWFGSKVTFCEYHDYVNESEIIEKMNGSSYLFKMRTMHF